MRPDRPSAHNNLGLSFFEYGEFDDALAHYKKAIEYEPTSVHHNNRGLAYFHFDKLEDAKNDFDIAIGKDPKNPTIHFNLGNVYLNWKGKKKFDEAIACYDKALKIQKDSAPVGNQVVKVLHSKGLAYQGMAEAKKAESAKLYLNKNTTNEEKEEVEEHIKALYYEAIEHYKQAI